MNHETITKAVIEQAKRLREVRTERESLPEEVRTLILEMHEKLNTLSLTVTQQAVTIADLSRRVTSIEGVSINDMIIRRTA